jgi:hypothetical protein
MLLGETWKNVFSNDLAKENEEHPKSKSVDPCNLPDDVQQFCIRAA